jgi:hypothetical protein
MSKPKAKSLKVCKHCGKRFWGTSRRVFCSDECRHAYYTLNGYTRHKGGYTKDTLCWECKKSTNDGCSWSKDFTPVEGWGAIPTSIKMVGKSKRNKGKIEPSFKVNACPSFERG